MKEHPDAQSVCLQRGTGERMGREEERDGRRRRVTGGGGALREEEWDGRSGFGRFQHSKL